MNASRWLFLAGRSSWLLMEIAAGLGRNQKLSLALRSRKPWLPAPHGSLALMDGSWMAPSLPSPSRQQSLGCAALGG